MPNDELLQSYSCLEEWFEAKGSHLSTDRTEPDQGRSELFTELRLIRETLWQRHLTGLPADIRVMLENGTHPSYSWDYADEAIPYLDALRQQLASVDYVTRIALGYYHGDSLIITVDVEGDVPWREYRKHIPEYYCGFHVKVLMSTT